MVQNYNAFTSTSAFDDVQFFSHSQASNGNPTESIAAQTTSLLTNGSPVEGWWVSDHLELKIAGEAVEIPPWATDYSSGGFFEIVAPFDPLPSTDRVEECSHDNDTSTEGLNAWLPKLSNLRSDANFNDQVFDIIEPENTQLTLSTNVASPFPNSQGCINLAKLTDKPATATFSADYCPPVPSSYSSMGQVNASSSWTGGLMTAFYGAPPNYGQLTSYPPQFTGQAVVASDTPVYFNTTTHGANTPVAHFPVAGWHQSMYRRLPCNAPATVSGHLKAQMGGGYSPYNPVSQATVPPSMQAYAEASMPVYGAILPLTQAPTMGALPAYERQPRKSPATMRAQAARRHDPDRPWSASKRIKMSGEPELYCQWGDCSAGPMTETKVLEHFRAHGEKIKESGRVKECKWAGCDPKPGAFPMTSDGFRRHVNETQSHAGIGGLTKIKCETCGMKRAKRSMPHHRSVCSGKSKEPEEEAGLT